MDNKTWRRKAAHLLNTRPSQLPNGFVLYEGPSEIDDTPIVVIVTGVRRPSSNAKTGDLLQTWILRQDMPPHEAVKTGHDAAICGDCPFRPTNNGGCYVLTHQGPRAVYAAWKAGRYPKLSTTRAVAILAGAHLRFGAYGDPAAAPLTTWAFRPFLVSHTGYTHRWRKLDPALWGWLMASADTQEDREDAVASGWRYFGVASGPVKGAIACLAETVGAPCTTCKLCAGWKRSKRGASLPSVVIRPHGWQASKAARVEA